MMINSDLSHELLWKKMNPALSDRSGKDFSVWKEELRQKFIELTGVDEIAKNACPLNLQIEWEKDKETGKMKITGKVVKKISYDIDTQACIKLIDLELKQRELDKNLDKYSHMSDEELQAEKMRLLRELREAEENGE